MHLSGRQALLVWEDERGDAGDVYAQNILGAGGALGIVTPGEVSPPGSKAPLRFLDGTNLAWEPGPASGSAVFNLYRASLSTIGTGPLRSLLPERRLLPGSCRPHGAVLGGRLLLPRHGRKPGGRGVDGPGQPGRSPGAGLPPVPDLRLSLTATAPRPVSRQ